MKKTILALIFTSILAVSAVASECHILRVEGIIDAAHADYIVKGIENAEKTGASAVILSMDTPGGLMKSMRKIIDKILESKVPVITYVSPKGAHAASAGTFILMASHVAAMAEGTNIGTASPIDLKGNKADEKITNDSIAYIRNLARLRGRNQEWAEKTITKNISSSEVEALKDKVIDLTAPGLPELLEKLKGRKVQVSGGEVTIPKEDMKQVEIPMSARHKFLHMLADPNIAYILFIIGTYGLIYELAHPGVLFPGVAGAISLVLAFIGFESMPINVAGIILIVLALGLFIAEALTPTFGALLTGGIVSLAFGSILLFPARGLGEDWAPSYTVIVTMIILTTLIVGFALMAIFRAQRAKKVMGKESMIGLKGLAETDVTAAAGVVNVGGEEWQAFSDDDIKPRDIIEVLEVNGMKLKVKKIEKKKGD